MLTESFLFIYYLSNEFIGRLNDSSRFSECTTGCHEMIVAQWKHADEAYY